MDETCNSIEVRDGELNQLIDFYNESSVIQDDHSDLLNNITNKISACLCDESKMKARKIKYGEIPHKRILRRDEESGLWIPIKEKTRLKVLRMIVKYQAKVSYVRFNYKKQLSICMMCKNRVKVGLNIFHNNPKCSENNILCYSCMTKYIYHKNNKCPLCYTSFDFNQTPSIVKYKKERKINDENA